MYLYIHHLKHCIPTFGIQQTRHMGSGTPLLTTTVTFKCVHNKLDPVYCPLSIYRYKLGINKETVFQLLLHITGNLCRRDNLQHTFASFAARSCNNLFIHSSCQPGPLFDAQLANVTIYTFSQPNTLYANNFHLLSNNSSLSSLFG